MKNLNQRITKIVLCLFIAQIALVTADLPVHCVKNQVLGAWQIQEGKVLTQKNDLSCGHTIPDKQETSNLALGGELSQVEKTIQVTLGDDFIVRGEDGGQGEWSFVYDEGWEINYQGTKYTHFFKYYKDNGEYKSDCSVTLVGWFNQVSEGNRGCSSASKVNLSGNENSVSLKHATVLSPTKNIPEQNEQIFSSKHIFKFEDKSEDLNKHSSIYEHKSKKFLHNKEKHTSSYPSFSNSIFVEIQKESSKDLHINHQEMVDRLNKIEGKTWTAKVPVIMAELSLAELNQRIGIRKQKYESTANQYEEAKESSFIQTSSISHSSKTDFSHFALEDVSDLPKQFSHEQYLHAPRDQGNCGSCYSIATAAMLSSRLWLKNGDSTQIAPQHSLSCNYFNQGCDGGYGVLVSKFYSEYEAVPEKCHPYTGKDGKCSDSCNVNSLDHVYTVTDYGYIGGAYGKTTERSIMEEIMKNGPIVSSFEPKMDFVYYGGGIYHSTEPREWIQNNESRPVWSKVDHSVLCYGWGEDKDGKYWLLQNSWGPDWGEGGNFRMRRGSDESNIESMAEWATIKKKPRGSSSKRENIFLQESGKGSTKKRQN